MPQNPFGFGAQGQQSFPQNLFLQGNQQRDQSSVSNGLLKPSQRFTSSRQATSNSGW